MDNHVISQGEAEYEKRFNCPDCGKGSLIELDWCGNDNYECTEDCNSYNPKFDCPVKEIRLRCDNCESVMRGE